MIVCVIYPCDRVKDLQLSNKQSQLISSKRRIYDASKLQNRSSKNLVSLVQHATENWTRNKRHIVDLLKDIVSSNRIVKLFDPLTIKTASCID